MACKCHSVNAWSWQNPFSCHTSLLSTCFTILAVISRQRATLKLSSTICCSPMRWPQLALVSARVPCQKRWCSHRFCLSSSWALGWWILLQMLLLLQTPRPGRGCSGRDGSCAELWARLKSPCTRHGDQADVRSLEFTSPPPCLCLFPLSSPNKCWKQFRSWLIWISWSTGR